MRNWSNKKIDQLTKQSPLTIFFIQIQFHSIQFEYEKYGKLWKISIQIVVVIVCFCCSDKFITIWLWWSIVNRLFCCCFLFLLSIIAVCFAINFPFSSHFPFASSKNFPIFICFFGTFSLITFVALHFRCIFFRFSSKYFVTTKII